MYVQTPTKHLSILSVARMLGNISAWHNGKKATARINTCSNTSIGISKNDKPQLAESRLYPTATNQTVVFDNVSNQVQNLLIVNFLGQIVSRFAAQPFTQNTIEVADFAKGQYVVKSETTGEIWRFMKL